MPNSAEQKKKRDASGVLGGLAGKARKALTGRKSRLDEAIKSQSSGKKSNPY